MVSALSLSRKHRERWTPYLLSAPAVLFLSTFFMFPLIVAFWMSFRAVRLWEIQTGGVFIGLQNYITLLQSSGVLNSIRVTVIFTLVASTLELIIGVAIAVFLNREFIGRKIVGTIVLVPMLVTPVVIGLMFRLLFNRQYGLINSLLGLLDLGPFGWLSEPTLAVVAIVLAETWNQVPFVVLVVLAALKTLPAETIEAALVDGATPVQVFWKVSVPLISSALLLAFFWRSIAIFRIYDVLAIMTEGGPVNATQALSLRVRSEMFDSGRVGSAAALSFILIGCLVIITLIYAFLQARFEKRFE